MFLPFQYAVFGGLNAQTLYFKLKDTENMAQLSDGRAVFSQNQISSLLGAVDAKPVLKHPEKFHSVYAERLARTYQVDLNQMSAFSKKNMRLQLQASKHIEYVEVEEDDIPTQGCPTDDPRDAPWNLQRHEMMCVQEAFCHTQGSTDIIIGIFDIEFNPNHPEFDGKVAVLHPNANIALGHGTHVAGAAAAATDNGFGISASGYNSSLGFFPGGHFAYEDAINSGVRIFNHSTGGCQSSSVYQTKVNLATEQGIIIVGAAANGSYKPSCGNNHGFWYPASYENVISVSGVGRNKHIETTFNCDGVTVPPYYSTHNDMVDVLCQAHTLELLDGTNSFLCGDGTSFAAPQVAGVIGLMLAVNPCLNHDDVLSLLLSTGQDVSSLSNNQTYYPNGNVPPIPCAESAVLAAQTYIGPDLVITTDTDWDQKFVSGKVIVKPGATLTIHGIASMSTNSEIIVEKGANLVIDGGMLTSCHAEWKGIVVEGDAASGTQNNAGRIALLNNAVIENARTAISMNPSHLQGSQIAAHYGGLVQADNATFRNCNRAVAFMKYATDFIEDESYFHDCTFENIATSAVTIWLNNNVTFERCIFNIIGENGIYAVNSEVIVRDGCIFTNQPTGIDILTTGNIPFAPIIGQTGTAPNEFQCDQYGIYAQAMGNSNPLLITNNNFLGSQFGVHITGLSNYQIFGNDMLGGYTGVEPVSTSSGTHRNEVRNNNISSMTYGSLAEYNNENLHYLDNCFASNNYADVLVSTGEIFVEQGNYDLANGNCFSKGGVPEIDNTGNAAIKLWVKANEPTSSCKYPTVVNNDPNFNVVVDLGSVADPSGTCGSMYSPGVINIRRFCQGPFKSKQDYLDKISEIQATILTTENDNSLTAAYRAYLLRIYRKCLHWLQAQIIVVILEPAVDDPDGITDPQQRMEAAIQYGMTLPLFDQQILALGLMVNTDQLSRARTYLNSIPQTTAAQSDYVWAQNLYLDYLATMSQYTLSAQDETTLFAIGKGIDPLDGYARSIYEVITGTRIVLDLPDPHNSVRPRSTAVAEAIVNFTVYPNPSHQHTITVAIEGMKDVSGLNISIIDIHGRLVLTESVLTFQHTIDISDCDNGTYIITVQNEKGNIEYVDKLVIIK